MNPLKLTPATNTVSGVSIDSMRFSVSALVALVAAASTRSPARQGATGRAADARSAVPRSATPCRAVRPDARASAIAMAMASGGAEFDSSGRGPPPYWRFAWTTRAGRTDGRGVQ